MKMKKYSGASMADAMTKVKSDLGDDAVILNSKVVYTKGFLGMFKKKSFEVFAGVDSVTKEVHQPIVKQPEMDRPIHMDSNNELSKEIADLKKMVQSLKVSSSDVSQEKSYDVLEFLREQEVNEELVTQLRDELFVLEQQSSEELTDDEQYEYMKSYFQKEMTDLPFGGFSYSTKYINLLGPTGVGKTTTIAKLAARAILEKKKKVAFITTDTYRIAAIEQLKTYANLLQSPVEVVYKKEDFEAAIEKFHDKDIVFIDTAGRNYKEEKFLHELQQLIPFHEQMKSYLVLSSTAKEKDLVSIVETFEQMPYEQFIFTKIDETNSIGSLVYLMIKYKKGLAYYTDGQEVPEDLVEASFEEWMKLLFKEYANERSS